MTDAVTAEDVADAALAWIWHSGSYFAPSHLDSTGDAFREICLKLGGRFAAEVEAFQENDRRERERARVRDLAFELAHRERSDDQRAMVALRAVVYERDGFACCECGATEDLTLDHVVPYSRGGRAVIDNLRTLCRRCNSRKGAKV